MRESPGRRPYPPEQIWRFPLPPVSRSWLVAAILAGVLGLTGLGVAATYFAVNGESDIPGFIDDETVVRIAKRECRLMRSTVERLPMDGSPDQRLASLADQNTAVTTMVARIRSVHPDVRKADRPVDAWLADWEALVTGREDYLGQQLKGGKAEFRIPRTADGDPITTRMNDAAVDICTVPKTLLRPDLAGANSV